MKNAAYILLFFISITVFSQQKAIEITNSNTIILAIILSQVGAYLLTTLKRNYSAFSFFTIGIAVIISSGIVKGIKTNNSNRNWAFKIIEK